MNPTDPEKTSDADDTVKMIRMLIHEIKNPLSAIYLSIDCLKNAKEDGDDPEQYYQLLEKSAKKIDTIMNEWLQSREEKS